MSPGEDEDFEHSSLSGPVSHDGETIDLEIYRRADSQAPWPMEVVHIGGGCTRWSVEFATDQEAVRTFRALVAEHGLAIFTSRRSDPQH
ncbi:hypothetical protein MCBMB27_00925 [Methylobacterium phyllosphaerae]|uniref:Uncharacterized protein n=2 Tax=Methylobacterium TaxID=407 RepID=A0ABN4UDY2_9HYPH|nr:protein of unassigned function [Methylobacterium oryzae CBMB20]APT30216.1 hypothetical protein MCBMB27_00925 [Methylobacterium phyllosphaerae]